MSLSFILKVGVAIANEDLIKFMYTLKNAEGYVKSYCKHNQLPSISDNIF